MNRLKKTDGEAWRQFLDVVQRDIDPHYPENQLVLVLMRHKKDREGKTHTLLISRHRH